MKKFVSKNLTLISVLALFTIFFTARLVWGWTNPSQNPPNGSGVLTASGGNVGIGTTNPGARTGMSGSVRFDVAHTNAKATADAEQQVAFFGSSDAAYPLGLSLGFRSHATAGSRYATIDASEVGSVNRPLYLQSISGGHVIMGITGSGNVGIGEVAPGSKLSVSGGGSFGAGYDTTAAPTNGLIIEGNIGVGTTTPGAKLGVAGSLIVDGPNAVLPTGSISTSEIADDAVTQKSRLLITSGNITTTAQTFTDLTGATITITTGANPVMIVFTGNWTNSFINYSLYIDVDIDGVRQGGGTDGLFEQNATAANHWYNASFTYLTAALTAGSHTFKIQWRVNGYTGTMKASGQSPFHFAVIELKK